MLKECTHKNTIIIAFVASFYNDAIWGKIRDWAKSKDIGFIHHLSTREDGVNLIKEYVDQFTKEAKEREDEKENPKPPKVESMYFDEEEEEEPKPRKSKYQYPECIFIFDDISKELRSLDYATFLKSSRHWHIRTISSSQNVKDLLPEARDQIKIWILFGGLKKERLETIWQGFENEISFDDFLEIYYKATAKKYNFLYVAPEDADFRHNFTHRFNIPEKYL
jgi:hypothetical protein